MVARLRAISRQGYLRNKENYEKFGDLHYVKCHGFRAYCFEYRRNDKRVLVVCSVVAKKTNTRLDDSVRVTAERIFESHRERYG
jgi:hypothetical protein